MWGKIKRKKYYLIMLAICVIPRIILSSQALPFRTRADEVGTLAGTAYLAGFDWSDLVGETAYYGFGAMILFTPLFYIFSNPILIYKLMIGVWGILQAMVGCIAWKLGRKYFRIEQEQNLMFLSIIASYTVVTRNTALFNETPIIVVMWLLIWCLLELLNCEFDYHKKRMITVIFTLILIYSLTLHTRTLIFWLSAAVIQIVYLVTKKRTLFSMRIFLILGIPGYLCVKKLVDILQDIIWLADKKTGLPNTQIAVNGIELIFFPESWQAWLNIIIGQLNTFSLVTGTVVLVGCVWICREYLRVIKNRFRIDAKKVSYFYVLSFAACCFLGTILGQSISEWLGYAVEGMKNGMDNQAYGLKVFTYIRYAGPYLGVIIWGILSYIIKYREDIMNIKTATIVTCFVTHIYWIVCILPYIYHNQVTNEAYLPFGFINNLEDSTRLRTYLAGTIVIIFSVIFFWNMISRKKTKYFLGFYMCFLIYQYCYDGYYQDIMQMKQSFSEVENTYAALQILDRKNELPANILICDSKNSSHQTSYVYQFCFFDKKIITLSDINDKKMSYDKGIIVVNSVEMADLLKQRGYEVYTINSDTEEYLATNTEDIEKILIKANYSVLK